MLADQVNGRPPRWLVILAWSTGPPGCRLAALAYAALVEHTLSVDVAFGRLLGFVVGSIYLALPLWGFLPYRPVGRFVQRGLVLVMTTIGLITAIIASVVTALWLSAHRVPAVGWPVVISIAVLIVAAIGTLALAGHEDRDSLSRCRPR